MRPHTVGKSHQGGRGRSARVFTAVELARIKRMLDEGYPYNAIALRFGISARRVRFLASELKCAN